MLLSFILWSIAIASSVIQFIIGYFHKFSLGFFLPTGFTFFIVWSVIYVDTINIPIAGSALIMGFLWYTTCYIKGRNFYNQKIEKGQPSN